MKKVNAEDLDFDYDLNLNTLNDKPFTGISVETTKDNTIEEVTFIEGKKNGYTWVWHPNGIMKSEEMFLANSLHGVSKLWNNSGNLIKCSLYEYGYHVLELKESIPDVNEITFQIDLDSIEYSNLLLLRKSRRIRMNK